MPIPNLTILCSKVLKVTDIINFGLTDTIKCLELLEDFVVNYKGRDKEIDDELDLLIYVLNRLMNDLRMTFNEVIEMIRILRQDGGVITGSYMLQCYTRTDFKKWNRSTDIDIFVTETTNLTKFFDKLGTKFKRSNDVISGKYRERKFLKKVYYYYQIDEKGDELWKNRYINIIQHIGEGVGIDNFDISLCKIIFDGYKIYCPKSCYSSVMNKEIIVYEDKLFDHVNIMRINKYFNYGYDNKVYMIVDDENTCKEHAKDRRIYLIANRFYEVAKRRDFKKDKSNLKFRYNCMEEFDKAAAENGLNKFELALLGWDSILKKMEVIDAKKWKEEEGLIILSNPGYY